jgi:RNA polymerase sigma-70 factor (ECF subfamily)
MPRPSDKISPALEEVLLRFGTMVRKVGWQHGLSDAEVDDVVQDVRIRIWKALEGPENISEVNASYVYRTAVSAALDLIRRRRTRRETPIHLSLETKERQMGAARAPDRTYEDSELAREVFEAVDALAEARRPVVRMHLAGYHRNEIAQLLGWSEAKTRNLL